MIVQGEKQTVNASEVKELKTGLAQRIYTKMQTFLNRLHSFKTKKAEPITAKDN